MLLVLGDSHSIIWGGRLVTEGTVESRFPLVKLRHLGPALAYNLVSDSGGLGKWGQSIINRVEVEGANATAILLSFGEIDIRTQIVKRAVSERISMTDAVAAVVGRYSQFVALLRKRVSIPIFLWGPIASTRDFAPMNADFPVIGSEVERNAATNAFNALLDAEAQTFDRVYHVSINDHLIGRTMTTRSWLLDDGYHLGLEALEIAIERLNQVCARAALALPDYFAAMPVAASGQAALRDIAGSARIIQMSSNHMENAPGQITKNACKGNFVFHTKKDLVPFVVVDIGYSAIVRIVRIYNRVDGYYERARSLEISVGIDRKNYRIISPSVIGDFGQDGRPVEIAVDDAKSLFRYMYMRLRESEYFHLGGVEILAESFV